MKINLRRFIVFVLTLCMIFPTALLCACNGDTGTDGTTEGNGTTTKAPDGTTGNDSNPETPATPVDPASLKGPIKDGARILVVGNSYVHYGRCVISKGKTVLTQESRENDKGYLYQVCKQNGVNVNVTNWCFGGHGLLDCFGGKCTNAGECFGVDHDNYLIDRNFDYVILSPSAAIISEITFISSFEYIMGLFKEANPNVKFVCLANLSPYGYSSWKEVVPSINTNYKTLEKMGVIIADWGSIVKGIIDGTYKIPGSTINYKASSFVVKDGFHPNMLTGYITALVAYCAITGERALGQPYEFATDPSVSTSFNATSYISSTYNSPSDTNFDKIFKSETDMRGIQQIIDQYLDEAPYRKLETVPIRNDFEDDKSEMGLLDGKKIIFIGNIYLSNGRMVTTVDKTKLTQKERTIDKGYFSNLCRMYGSRAEITNWTWDSHGLSDLFGNPCSRSGSCQGIRHEEYLLDRNFDYVVMSPGSAAVSESGLLASVEYIMNFFREANPNVKFVFIGNLGAYGYSSYGEKREGMIANYKTLENMGIAIADFGGLIDGIITGKYTVPGSTQTYNKMSFLVKNGYNVNPLTGYISTLMVYRAITGESVEGKRYSFWDSPSINRNFVTSTYMTTHYGTTATNFDDILGSATEVRGIQKLIDQYMTEKPWMK